MSVLDVGKGTQASDSARMESLYCFQIFCFSDWFQIFPQGETSFRTSLYVNLGYDTYLFSVLQNLNENNSHRV
jgi:hypothetical protein